MPQMGVSVSEGTITKWLKQEGEHVDADEPLLEISTDKVDTEVPSPGSGTLTRILAQEGETVEVGTKIGQIGGTGGDGARASDEQIPEPAPAAAAAEAQAASDVPAPTPTAEQVEEARPAAQPTTSDGAGAGEKTFASPVVARIASEHGVDPTQVEGTGRGGRVTKKDILAFIEASAPMKARPPAEPAAATAPAAPQPPTAPPPPTPAPEAAR